MNLRNLFQSTVSTSLIMHFSKAAVLALPLLSVSLSGGVKMMKGHAVEGRRGEGGGTKALDNL